MRNLKVSLNVAALSFLVGCAPLPTREDGDAFKAKVRGTVPRADTALFMDCLIDGFNRTENAIKHDIKTTQQRRSSGYRVERRWNLNQSLLIVSADISDDGTVELFKNVKLSSIAPFVKTKEEFFAFEVCLNKYKNPK
jgi:hypothetical protein